MTACGGDDTDTVNTGHSADSAVGEVTESEEANRLYIHQLPEADFGGEPFTVFGEICRDHYYVEEPDGEVINDAVFRRNNEIEERYNIDLAFSLVEWKEGPDTIKINVQSGDNAYDLLTCTHLYMIDTLLNGYYLDWADIPNVDLTKPYYVQSANTTYSIADKTLLLFGDFMDANITNCWVFLFNKSKAAEYDLSDLYEVVDSEKWTFDYFMSLIKNVESDLNGDGEMNESDFYGFATDRFGSADSFSRALHLTGISKDENNYPIVDFFKESTVDAYEALYEMYYNTAGVYVSEETWKHIDNVFVPGNAIFSNALLEMLCGEALRDMKDDYGVLPYPKWEESDTLYATYLDGTFSAQMLSVTLSDEQIERAGLITEALNAYSAEYVRPAIYDTTLKEKTSRDEESIRMLDLVLAGRQFSFDSMDEKGYPFSPYQALRGNIGDRKNNIASYYEKNANKAQKWIDKIVDAFESAGQ